MKKRLAFSAWLFLSQIALASAQPNRDWLTPEQFGAVVNDTRSDLAAFQRAAAAATRLKKDLKLSGGTYLLDNASGDKLANLIVLTDVRVVGTPTTTIRFTYNGLPLFSVVNSSRGGFVHCRFVFTGTTQRKPDFPNQQINAAQGLALIPGIPRYEYWTVFFVADSDNLRFENLSFESATPGVPMSGVGGTYDTGISFCFNLKGKRGNVAYAEGLKMHHLRFRDCIHGILLCTQRNFNLSHLLTERRFGNQETAPGHLIYLTGNPANLPSRNGTLSNLIDLGRPINLDGRGLAPLAVKVVENVRIRNVISYHPEGLIQSLQAAKNCSFTDFLFVKADTCTSTIPVLNLSGKEAIAHNVFRRFTLLSPQVFVRVLNISGVMLDSSSANSFDSFTVVDDFNPLPGRPNTYEAFVLAGRNNAFRGITVQPSQPFDSVRHNLAFAFRGERSANEVADLTVVGPHAQPRLLRNRARWAGDSPARSPSPDLVRLRPESELLPNARAASSAKPGRSLALPGAGMYLVRATVSDSAGAAQQGSTWLVTLGSASPLPRVWKVTPTPSQTRSDSSVLTASPTGVVRMTDARGCPWPQSVLLRYQKVAAAIAP